MAKALREAKAKAPKMVATGPKETSGPEVAQAAQGQDAPSSGAATGTSSTNEPPQSDDQGGAGDPAGSAGSLTLEDLDKRLGTAEDQFRATYPHLSAALNAWQATSDQTPEGVRIVSKIDGFRRAGIRHSRQAIEHLIEDFKGPEQLEALLAEPNLVVELI